MIYTSLFGRMIHTGRLSGSDDHGPRGTPVPRGSEGAATAIRVTA